MRGLKAVVLVIALYAGAVGVGTLLRGEVELSAQTLSLPSADVARLASLGFNGVVADFYFVRALQYFGSSWNEDVQYRDLYPLLDLITEVDPKFREPLAWGGVAVQRNLGRETWVNTAESSRLFRKGVERFPDDPRFPIYLAYNLAFFDRDFIGAAKVLERAIGHEGTPEWVPALVARLYSSAGRLDAAAQLSEAVMASSADPKVKEIMKQRLIDIDTERRMQTLDDAIARFFEQEGRWPGGLYELVPGFVPMLPEEPRGGEWKIDETAHTVTSTKMKNRLRVFEFSRPARKAESEAGAGAADGGTP